MRKTEHNGLTGGCVAKCMRKTEYNKLTQVACRIILKHSPATLEPKWR